MKRKQDARRDVDWYEAGQAAAAKYCDLNLQMTSWQLSHCDIRAFIRNRGLAERLRGAGICRVGDLYSTSEVVLWSVPGMGRVKMDAIKFGLANYGAHLGMIP